MILEILFFCSVYFIIHTYVFYPLLVDIIGKKKIANTYIYSPTDELPTIDVIIAAYNEDAVIEEKLRSIYNTTYPNEKIKVYVGSDSSTDTTDDIVQRLAKELPNLTLTRFEARTGKAGIINQLTKKATSEVFVLTDANVIFESTTLFQLTKHFKNPAIKIVGAHTLYKEINQTDGIALQEDTYLNIENSIKINEGNIWGASMGVEGSCYAIRKEEYSIVPPNFIVDDFFITMEVLKNGGKVIFEKEAICYESAVNDPKIEFKRKVRISSGNFQNLNYFKSVLLKPFKGYAFAYWSHKVLRWLTPFFILIALISNFLLINSAPIYLYLFIGQLCLFLLPIIDLLFKRLGLNIQLLRYIAHFYYMNIALLFGFYQYAKGIHTNVWHRTERKK